MRATTAFCSACDRDVRVILPEVPPHDAQAPVSDAEIVCLEVGERCTGALCPVGAVSPTVMRVRHVRSGVASILQPVVKAECEACSTVTDFYIVAPEYATCVECGRTVPLDQLTIAMGRDG